MLTSELAWEFRTSCGAHRVAGRPSPSLADDCKIRGNDILTKFLPPCEGPSMNRLYQRAIVLSIQQLELASVLCTFLSMNLRFCSGKRMLCRYMNGIL